MDFNQSHASFIESKINQVSANSSNHDNVKNWTEIDASLLKDLEKPFDFAGGDSDSNTNQILRKDDQYIGFDNTAGDKYIYPINYPIRAYQFNITKISLYRNTLIVLPTGLGKTFIAAVVMYNIYRWYPTGKVIFMAPTRPLVSQQIEACRQIMGMPTNDMAEMTGKQNKKLRTELWQNKRIFFATPQVVQIDISDPDVNFPFHKIKLIVVDEAHKAKGRYAYTEVIQTVINRNPYFRVLGLSATPGRRIEDVMEVVQNLCISHIEVRNENSIDVMAFTHKKNIKTVVVPLGEQLSNTRSSLINIIDPYIRNLINAGILNGNTGNFSKFWLLMEQKRFREQSIQKRHPKHSAICTDFSICISLYHALELLERHGLRVFLNFFDDPEQQNEKFFVQTNPKLRKLLTELREEVGPNPFAISDQTMTNGEIHKIPDNLDFGHPKFDMVKKFLLDHFNEDPNSKVIIFCEFRESVMLMHRLLLQSRPLILPKVFVGQGGAGSIRAVSQKEQIKVMQDFRSGIANTLIATSVAEEGIDVGEVNLIICFDISSKNPTRFVQRIGRTGRKRQGQVIMLATEGKEQSLVKEVLASKDKINQKIVNNTQIKNVLYKRSPRIVPPEYDPKCLEVFITTEEEKTTSPTKNKKGNRNRGSIDDGSTESKKQKKDSGTGKKTGRKKKVETVTCPSQDVRNFFKKKELDNEDKEFFSTPNKQNSVNLDSNDDELLGFENSVTNFDDIHVTNEISEPTATSTTNNTTFIESRFKKLNHIARQLDKKPNYPNYANILETLKSKTINKNVKEFVLKNNKDFVREKYEAMEAISTLNIININNPDVEIIDDSEKIIKSQYAQIEEIFGSKFEVKYFIDGTEINQKYKFLQDLDNKFNTFFGEFEEREFTDCVQEFVDSKCKEIEENCLQLKINEEPAMDISGGSQCLIEDYNLDDEFSDYDDGIFNEIQPKLEVTSSQWLNFNTKIIHQSTPISKQFMKTANNMVDESPVNLLQAKAEKQINLPTVDEIYENIEEQHSASAIDFYDKLEKSSKNMSKFNSPMHVDNSNKKDELSADLFDDGFDLILADNEVLKSIEKNNSNDVEKPRIFTLASERYKEKFTFMKNVPPTNHFAPPVIDKAKSPKASFSNNMNAKLINFNVVEKPRIFTLASESYKEKSTFVKNVPPTNHFAVPVTDKLKSPKSSFSNNMNAILSSFNEKYESLIPEFDLNDFLEPFEEEAKSELPYSLENLRISSQKENASPSKKIENTFNSRPLEAGSIKRRNSDDIFDLSSLESGNEKDKSPENQVMALKNDAPLKPEIKMAIKEISPSLVGRRRPNLSHVKYIPKKLDTIYGNMKETSKSNIHTVESLSSTREQSINAVFNPTNNNSRVPNHYNDNKSLNDTSNCIIRPHKNLNRVIDSSDSEEDNNENNRSPEIINPSQEIQTTPGKSMFTERWNKRKINRKKRRRCEFLDDEAGHSGDDSDDSDPQHDNGEFLSLIASQDEPDDSNVNMHAKYLQSIRTPRRLPPGAFKIPPHREYMDLSNIFSQAVPDEEKNEEYKECSFVVSDDENVVDGEISYDCPLERAEAILKARRKAKRKQHQEENANSNNKRRRIISNIRPISISDDDFE